MRGNSLAFLLALLAPSLAQAACEIPKDWRKASSGEVAVAFRADPSFTSGQFFAIDFRTCGVPPGGDPLPRVDMTMPAHGHGMNYRPKVTRVAPGQFRAEGMFLHMTGAWRLVFELPAEGGVTRVAADLDIPR